MSADGSGNTATGHSKLLAQKLRELYFRREAIGDAIRALERYAEGLR